MGFERITIDPAKMVPLCLSKFSYSPAGRTDGADPALPDWIDASRRDACIEPLGGNCSPGWFLVGKHDGSPWEARATTPMAAVALAIADGRGAELVRDDRRS